MAQQEADQAVARRRPEFVEEDLRRTVLEHVNFFFCLLDDRLFQKWLRWESYRRVAEDALYWAGRVLSHLGPALGHPAGTTLTYWSGAKTTPGAKIENIDPEESFVNDVAQAVSHAAYIVGVLAELPADNLAKNYSRSVRRAHDALNEMIKALVR